MSYSKQNRDESIAVNKMRSSKTKYLFISIITVILIFSFTARGKINEQIRTWQVGHICKSCYKYSAQPKSQWWAYQMFQVQEYYKSETWPI